MRLYFFRHGEADWPNWKQPDDERPLNKKGIEETREMARLLKKLHSKPALILTSPLPRAYQTATIVSIELAVPLETESDLSPGCTGEKLESFVQRRAKESVMVVGHEPDFSSMLRELTGARLKIGKSGVARVDLENGNAGKLIWLLPAKVGMVDL